MQFQSRQQNLITMIKIYFSKTKATLKVLTLSLSLLAFKLSAQCPTGALFLDTQTAVNSFATNYPNCTTISGNLTIGAGISSTTPSNITDVSPLAKITQVNGTVFIQNNALLQNLDGLKISNITGRLYIGGDNAGNTNPKLQNLNGLSSLTNVGQFLQILRNPLLTQISGLANLKTIGQDIEIDGNTVLSNISGLQGTTFNPNDGYGLTITNNPALAVCNLPNFCAYIAKSSNTYPRIISGNLTSCLNETAVKVACGFMSVTDIDKSNITVYPNPVKFMLNFSEEVSGIQITDLSGRTVKQFPTSVKTVDVKNLDNGTYIITATTKTGNTITKKLVKE